MSKCKISGKVLVIHLGREETRIVRMSGANVQHRAAFVTPKGAVEDGMIRNPEAVRELLKGALKTKEFRGIRQAVFVLKTSQIITSVANTPSLSDARLEKLLQANMDMYFPVDVQDYHVVWQIIGPRETDNGTKELSVQLWAVPNAITQRYYAVANSCGLSVAAIDYCGNSVATAVGAGFAVRAKAKKKTVSGKATAVANGGQELEPASSIAVEERFVPDTDLHISLEKELLGMTFIQEGRVVLQRFVRCGDSPIYQFSELAMILEYFRSMEFGRGSKITGILSGDYAEDIPVCRELAEVLGIQLQVIGGNIAPQMVMFVGAARTTVDFGVPELNRPGKVGREVKSQLWQYLLILVCGAVLVGVVLLSLSSQLIWDTAIRGLQNNLKAISEQAKLSNGFADNYKEYSNRYDAYSADWDSVYSSLQTYNDNLALVLQELETILPQNTSVTAMQIAPDGMNIQFACDGKEEAAYLIMALRDMKYANLAGISNLGGGGGGAADSYGPDGEEPPTKGSYDPKKDGKVLVTFKATPAAQSEGSAVEELILSELTPEELMAVGTGLTADQIALLETTYGKIPATNYGTLEDLKSKASPTPTFEDRKAALTAMFSEDPFAANHFVALLMEDFYRTESILMTKIFPDLLELQASGKLEFNPSDPSSMRESMDVLLGVLTKNEENLSATENLLCSEAKAEGKNASVSELTYVHYLEVQLKLRQKEAFPFLDLERVFKDLLSGGFNTGDKTLDSKLNGLISQKTWDLLKKFGSDAEVAKMTAAYLKNGTSGEPVADELIGKYLNNGSTGYPDVDKRIEAYIKSDEMGKLVSGALNQYLSTGSSDYVVLDSKFDAFFGKGTSGIGALDDQIRKNLSGSQAVTLMTGLMDKYLDTGLSENPKMANWIGEYLLNGTSGSKELDKLFASSLANGSLDGRITEKVNVYLEKNSSGNPVLDQMIARYKQDGNSGNIYLDRVFSNLLKNDEDPLDGWTEEELAGRFEKYLVEGTSADSDLDRKFNSYLTQKTSGNGAIDKVLDNYLDTDQAAQNVNGLVSSYLSNKGASGSKTADALIDGYFANDASGNEKIDKHIETYIESSAADAFLEPLVAKYAETGTTDIAPLDKKLSRYAASGTTGSKKLDALLGKNLPEDSEKNPFEGLSNSAIKDLLDKYFETGTSGNPQVDAVLDRYMNEGTTGDPALDTVLKGYLAAPEADGYITNMLIKYFSSGTTGRAALDKMIDDFILTGTTGNRVVDIAIIGSLATSMAVKESLFQMIDSYLAVGTTGNLAMDKAIENYLLKGTTGNRNLDNVIDEYLEKSSDKFENRIDEMFNNYLSEGTSGYIVFDKMIEKYLEEGTTGNRYADVVLKEYTTVKLEEMFRKYLEDGTSGVPGFDKLIENYLLKGTTGNAGYDKLIDEYMQSNSVKVLLKDLVDKFNKNDTTGNKKLDTAFKLYYLMGTTGNKKLDVMLKELGLKTLKDDSNKPGGDGDSELPDDWWDDIFGPGGNGGSGGIGGGTGEQIDTRVTFVAVLLYNEELEEAELIRKGLDYDGKIDKVEVEE